MKKKILSIFMIFSFALLVVACGGKKDPNQAAFDAAYQALSINPNSDHDKIVASFPVATKLRGGATAEWKSSDEVHAKITKQDDNNDLVTIKRPENGSGNASVKLTATVKLGALSKEKDFSIVILEEPAGIVQMTLAEVKQTPYTLGSTSEATTSELIGKTVRILNAVVVGIDTDAYYVSDGTTAMLVFDTPSSAIKVGQKGTLLAEVGMYYGSYQLSKAGWTEVTENNTVTPKEITLDKFWIAKDASVKTLVETKNRTDLFDFITFEATIVQREDFTGGANYKTTLVKDADNQDINFGLSYYKSNLHNGLAAYDGLPVTVTAVARELRDSRATNPTIGNRPVFSFSILSVELGELSDQQKVTLDKEKLTLPKEVETAEKLNLPTAGENGTTISWDYTVADDANNQYIDLSTGQITLPADNKQEKVKLTATVSLGAIEETKAFEVLVGPRQLSTIQVVNGVADGTLVYIKGIVSGISANNQVTIEDASGAITVFDSKGDLVKLVGKEVEVWGEKTTRNGLVQVTNVSKHEAGDTKPLPTAININDLHLNKTDLLALQGHLVSRDNLIVTKVDVNSYGNVTATLMDLTTEETIQLYWDSRVKVTGETGVDISKLVVGDIINIVAAPLGWNNNPQFGYNDKSQVVMSTDVVVVANEAELRAALAGTAKMIKLSADIVLTAELDVNRSVILLGNGKKVTGAEAGRAVLISANNVIINDLTVEESADFGIQAYKVTGVKLTNVTVTGSAKGGILVNGSAVTVEKLTLTNNTWGGIEVSQGTSVTETPVLKVIGEITYTPVAETETPVIWIDGKTTNDGWVVANQLDEVIKDNQLWFEKSKLVLLTTYSFGHLTGKGTTQLDAVAMLAAFNAGATGTNKLTSVENVSRIYDGNANGGAYPNTPGLLKTGTGDYNGEMKLVFTDANIYKVVIKAERWNAGATDKVTLNGIQANLDSGSGSSVTFNFLEATNTLDFVFARRAFIFSIEIYTA